jgi:hypothetical protein
VDKKANDTFAFDLENRLDDFFSDAMPSREDAPEADAAPESPALALKDLKSSILAIDWEITDQALEAFSRQVEDLQERFKADKITHTFLKLLKSLGKYMRVHKSKAHPEAIKRLMAVYAALEESLDNAALEQPAKEKMLLEEVREFQKLKARIMDKKVTAPAAGRTQSAAAKGKPDLDAVMQAIDQLKAMMTAEIAALREEIEQIRNQ